MACFDNRYTDGMTIDERLQFLLQSTEALHSNIHELIDSQRRLTETQREQGDRIDRLASTVAANAAQTETNTKQISLLIEAMRGLTGIVEAHENRLNG